MAPTPFEEFLFSWDKIPVGDWHIPILGIVMLAISIVSMVIIYLIITKLLGKRVKLQGLPPDLLNAFKFLFRLIIGVIIIGLIFAFLNIPTQFGVILSGIVATAIAFASLKAINNFVAGIFITLTRPFTVGDYVSIKGKEGIIEGISLVYTRIRHKTGDLTYLPNVDCLSTNVVNYTVSTRWFSKQVNQIKDSMERNKKILEKKKKVDPRREGIIKRLEEDLEEMRGVLGTTALVCRKLRRKERKEEKEGLRHSLYARQRRIVRYTFTMLLPKTPRKNSRVLNEICKKWVDEFELLPDWKIVGIGARLTYQIAIITPDPEDVTHYYDDFITDVYKKQYTKKT